jgi:hypothetical protein
LEKPVVFVILNNSPMVHNVPNKNNRLNGCM